MTSITNLPFSRADMLAALEAGHVNRQFHPEDSLEIWNYSTLTQIEQNWTEVTMACRGLIIDPHEEKIVARPFPKFFNHTQTAVPKFALTTAPVVMDKMDGSLGIIYPRNGGFDVATRGSFASDQAIWATDWLHHVYKDAGYWQPDGITTLVEIIYPENRIVVNYDGKKELVLLGAVYNETGADIPIWEIDWWPGERAEIHPGLGDMDEVNRFAISDAKKDAEGVVAVWYKPGKPAFRLKVKHDEYIRLHRIITGINTKTIWEIMSTGGDLHEVLDRVPDEFYGWCKGIMGQLQTQFDAIEATAIKELTDIYKTYSINADRKTIALAAKKKTYPGLIFAMLDNKPYASAIWKMIKPKAEGPYLMSETEKDDNANSNDT